MASLISKIIGMMKEIRICEPNLEIAHIVGLTDENGEDTFHKVEVDSDGKEVLPENSFEIDLDDLKKMKKGIEAKGEEHRKDWEDMFKNYEGFCKDKEDSVYAFRERTFLNCMLDGDNTGNKQSMNIPLSEEAYIYLASKFPSPKTDGCFTVQNDEYLNKIRPDEGMIEKVVASIIDDIWTNNLPAGVDSAKVFEIMDDLNRILSFLKRPIDSATKNLDIQLKATEKNMKEQLEANQENMDRMMWIQIVSTSIMGLMFYLQLRMAQKQMNLMMGKVEIKMAEIGFDMVQQERESIATNKGKVTQTILDLDEKATEYLRMLRRPKYGNPFLRGESGSGKDMIVRRAAQLLALIDPRIVNNPLLKPLLDKPLWYIDPTRAQKGAGVVGSGAKVMDAIAAALERGEMAYWPELAQGLRAFAHSKGESESPATLLKTILDKTKRGFSGSATDADFAEIAEWIGDVEQLERRMPVLRAVSKSAGEIFAIVKSSKVPEWGEHYNVRVDDIGLIDRAFSKLDEIRTRTGSSSPLFDAAESLLMSIFEEANKEGADKISQEHVGRAVQKLTSNGNGHAGKANGVHDEKMNAQVRERLVMEVRMARLSALADLMMEMREFAGDPDIAKRAERYFDRWLKMSREERGAHLARTTADAGNKAGIPKKLIQTWKAEDDKASQRPDDDDQSPPPVTAEGGVESEPASVELDDKNRTPISSAVGAGSSSIGIGKGKTMVSWWPDIQTVAEKAVNVVRKPVATAVTPEGFMFSVQTGVEAELSSVQKARLEANANAIQALIQRPFATNAGANLLFGWSGWLMIHEVIEPELGRELSGIEKLGAYVGTGILGSLALSSLAGASMRFKDLLVATPTGMLTFLPVGISVSSVANSIGIDPNTKEGELLVITAGGVLAAATSTATLPAFTAASLGGAMTIADAGLTLAGAVFGIGAGLAVGAAMLGGSAAGLAIDHGLGKAGLESSDGDETFSGWLAEQMFRSHQEDLGIYYEGNHIVRKMPRFHITK